MSDTYEYLGSFAGFAQHGTLQVEFPDTLPLIDPGYGLTVLLDGVDISLTTEQTPFDAMGDDPLLVFVGEEIMAVYDWNLLANGNYQLLCRRGKFGTPIETHASGCDVYLINQSELPVITHPQLRYNNILEWKVGPTPDPSGLTPINTTVSGKIFKLPKPINITLNGVSFNPMFSASEAVTLCWGLTEAGADLWQKEKYTVQSVVTFFESNGTTQLSARTVPNQTLRLSYPQLVTALGGTAQNFVLQVQFQTAGEWIQLLSAPAKKTILFV